MPGAGNDLKNAILNFFKGSNMPVATANLYLSLHSAPVGDNGGGTEITATITGGNRVAIPWGAIVNNEEISNNAQIVVTASAAGGGTWASFGIWSTPTPGTGFLHAWNNLSPAPVITAGQSVTIPTAKLVMTIDPPC